MIEATVPLLEPPYWALAQRSLFELLDQGWRRFQQAYTRPDGSLRYDERLSSRDGADDFLEAFFNWPRLYLLGGADDLLEQSARHWQAVAAQLTGLGMYRDEFEIGYDWFHQGESLLFFYGLTMADPAAFKERAMRFADLYVDPAHGNYDAALRIVKAPHNGSGGAREGVSDSPSYPWLQREADQYGYPLDWMAVSEATTPEQDPRLGAEMQQRLGRGDTAGNLAIGGLVLNAYLASGEQRYADWLAGYLRAWMKRADANDGLVPDNVGPDGQIGSRLDGRWYGGHYGWTWPHGAYSVGQAVLVGAMAAALANGDDSYLQLPRRLLDTLIAQGRRMAFTDSDSSIPGRWLAHLGPAAGSETLLVPYRHSDRGWFDYNPVQASVPVALWHHTSDPGDRDRLETLRAASGYDWSVVRPFRDKEEAGHEEPWYEYLAGRNPGFPEKILAAAHAEARRRLALLEQHAGEPVAEEDIHLWQNVNPVVTEALTMLTWGGPQVVYNGGHAQARVRHYDADARRPGLPPEVAALVSGIDPDATVCTLVNLSGTATRRVIVQAGAFAEHDFGSVAYDVAAPGWTGGHYEYISHEVPVTRAELTGDGPWITVVLPPGTQITVTAALRVRVRPPSFRTPWTG
ncbi:hypothetical protein ACIA5C_08810 [Actinoplanes sp. NPDC051343]|uniref:hypothetical protein n=1 Tax=Actinoplanes sp. NPDC051343 TaxID=3363906 RepID=UPI0037A5F756